MMTLVSATGRCGTEGTEMKIKVEGLDMAFSENSAEEAARRIAEQWGVIVELTGRTGGGGWPEVNIIGTTHQVMRMMTEDGGWSTGDDAEDAEMLFHVFRDAKVLFG
jgi:hypothetical protein